MAATVDGGIWVTSNGLDSNPYWMPVTDQFRSHALTGGLHYLTPPHANGHNWQVENGKINRLNTSLIMGVPEGWFSARAMVAFFDGHAEGMLAGDLEDMRLWANEASAGDYDFVP